MKHPKALMGPPIHVQGVFWQPFDSRQAHAPGAKETQSRQLVAVSATIAAPKRNRKRSLRMQGKAALGCKGLHSNRKRQTFLLGTSSPLQMQTQKERTVDFQRLSVGSVLPFPTRLNGSSSTGPVFSPNPLRTQLHLYKFWNPWTVTGARTERKIPALELESKELPGKTHGKLPVSEAFAIDKEMTQASLQGILP